MRYAAIGGAMAVALMIGILAANFDVTERRVARTSKSPVATADDAPPGATEVTEVGASMPAENASVAPPSQARQVIDSVQDVPLAQAHAERSVADISYRPDITESRSSAGSRQSGAATSATLAERLDSLGSNASVAAERQLFALWGIPDIAIDGEFCDQAAERGLVCFAKSGSWDKLRGFDLPALLTLRRDGAGSVQTLLTRLVGQDATLYLDGQLHRYRLHEVDRHWSGQFVLLWRPPLERVTVIHPAHFGESVQWLRRFFARVDGVKVKAENAADAQEQLAERIKDFQRRHGLFADGIAGPETLIHLSSVMPDSVTPSLSAGSVSAAGQGAHPTVAYLRE